MRIDNSTTAFSNALSMKQQAQQGPASRRDPADGEKKSPFAGSVFSGGQNDKNNMLNSLMDQKVRIAESKSNLINNTLEKGGTMDSIKDQIAAYDEQLMGIDEQIAKATLEDQQEALGIEKDGQGKAQGADATTPKTEEEAKAAQMNRLISVSADISAAETVTAVKTKMEGDAGVLESEIELDESRSNQIAQMKREKLSKLNVDIATVDNMIGHNMNRIIDMSKADNTITVEGETLDVKQAERAFQIEQFKEAQAGTVAAKESPLSLETNA